MAIQNPGVECASDCTVVVPSDTVDIVDSEGNSRAARALYLGTTSALLTILTPGGASCLFENVPVGILPVQCKRVMDTGTDALTDLVALF